MPHDGGADGIEPARELLDRNSLASFDALEQREISRQQETDVLRVLRIDLLDALGDDEPDARRELRVRSRFARRPASFRSPTDDDLEPAIFDRVLRDRAAAQTDEAIAGERFVVVVANPTGRKLVGRDVVDERARRIVKERVSRELARERLGIGGQIKNPSLDLERVAFGHPFTVARAFSSRQARGVTTAAARSPVPPPVLLGPRASASCRARARAPLQRALGAPKRAPA